MEKEEFLENFKNLNVPAEAQEAWWEKWKKHRFMFCCGNSNTLLDLFISEAKKRYVQAPHDI